MYLKIILGLYNFVNASPACGEQVHALPERITPQKVRIDVTSSRDRIFRSHSKPNDRSPPYLKTLGQDFGDAVRSAHVTPQSAGP